MEDNKKYFVPKKDDFTLGAKYQQKINGRWVDYVVDTELHAILNKRGGTLKHFTLRMEVVPKRPKDLVKGQHHFLKDDKIPMVKGEDVDYGHLMRGTPTHYNEVFPVRDGIGIHAIDQKSVSIVDDSVGTMFARAEAETDKIKKLKIYRDLYQIIWMKIEILMAKEFDK